MKKFKTLFFIIIILFLSNHGFGLIQVESQQNPLISQGIEYYKSGEYDSAISTLQEVINISVDKKELFTAYIYLGYTYFTLDDLDQASPNIDEAIKINPNGQLSSDEFVSEYIEYFKKLKNVIVGIGFFESIPTGSFLYIDKNKIGTTPTKNEFLAGKYWIRLVKWWYAPYEEEIEINPNEMNNFKFDLSKGKNWKTFARSSIIIIAVAFLFKAI